MEGRHMGLQALRGVCMLQTHSLTTVRNDSFGVNPSLDDRAPKSTQAGRRNKAHHRGVVRESTLNPAAGLTRQPQARHPASMAGASWRSMGSMARAQRRTCWGSGGEVRQAQMSRALAGASTRGSRLYTAGMGRAIGVCVVCVCVRARAGGGGGGGEGV